MPQYEFKYAIGQKVWVVVSEHTLTKRSLCPICKGAGSWKRPDGVIGVCNGTKGWPCFEGYLSESNYKWVARETAIDRIIIREDLSVVYGFKDYDFFDWDDPMTDDHGNPCIFLSKEEALLKAGEANALTSID